VGLRAGLDDVKKILDPTGTQTPTPLSSNPVSSRYTDCAIPVFGINFYNACGLKSSPSFVFTHLMHKAGTQNIILSANEGKKLNKQGKDIPVTGPGGP
jgi:hypothetical protein